jgi:hypothetical protein
MGVNEVGALLQGLLLSSVRGAHPSYGECGSRGVSVCVWWYLVGGRYKMYMCPYLVKHG